MSVTLHSSRKDLFKLFQKEKERILRSIPSIKDIHHVGSSAVPDLGGKNIIDILIGLAIYEGLGEITKKFEKLGYITKWINYKKEWTYLSNKLQNATEGDFHIHIIRKGSKYYKDWFLFRNYLISHSDERERYEKLKPVWLKKSKGVGMVYAGLKTEYIKSVLEKAKQEK